jgi:hypothetical protein
MTVREAIHRVWHKLENGLPSDDARLRPRRIYSAILSASALLRDKYVGKLSEWNYTTLSCVPLVKTTAHECGCIPVQDCSYYKTTCDIPDTIGTSSTAIKNVTSLDGSIVFSLTDWGSIPYLEGDRFSGKMPRYFVKNNKVFLINVPVDNLKAITLRGIFSDPLKALTNCNSCDDGNYGLGPCGSILDTGLPIDSKFHTQLIEAVINEMQPVARQDQVNDNLDAKV